MDSLRTQDDDAASKNATLRDAAGEAIWASS
ncbi:MAG: hypothetical protein ACI8UD_000956 [Planctomycetota bacterium]|jgi:hypothetical protein